MSILMASRAPLLRKKQWERKEIMSRLSGRQKVFNKIVSEGSRLKSIWVVIKLLHYFLTSVVSKAAGAPKCLMMLDLVRHLVNASPRSERNYFLYLGPFPTRDTFYSNVAKSECECEFDKNKGGAAVSPPLAWLAQPISSRRSPPEDH